jgi:hypothetical protein
MDATTAPRRIDLGDGAYLIQVPPEQGGDYDCFIRENQYIGSRQTEALARICIAEQQERERRHLRLRRVSATTVGVPERLQAAIAILEPCAGQLTDTQAQQLIADAIAQLHEALARIQVQEKSNEQRLVA